MRAAINQSVLSIIFPSMLNKYQIIVLSVLLVSSLAISPHRKNTQLTVEGAHPSAPQTSGSTSEVSHQQSKAGEGADKSQSQAVKSQQQSTAGQQAEAAAPAESETPQ
jgi:hypothetical protein